jgi:hypothetical protein
MSDPATEHDHVDLAERLRNAPAVTTALLREVMGGTAWRVARRGDHERRARIDQLIAAGAGADAALALIDLELPNWRLRRIVYDGGEWHCALSRQRELPEWLDQAIEGRHADLSLALLCALVEAQAVGASLRQPSVPTVARKLKPLYDPVCCDNFA